MRTQQEIFTDNLKYYLRAYEKQQVEVARAIGVNPTTFNTWVKGYAYPRVDKIQKLADYFHIQKSDLVDERSDEKERMNRLIAYYSKLSEEDKANVDLFIMALATKHRGDE